MMARAVLVVPVVDKHGAGRDEELAKRVVGWLGAVRVTEGGAV
jgi:hypothetical protein